LKFSRTRISFYYHHRSLSILFSRSHYCSCPRSFSCSQKHIALALSLALSTLPSLLRVSSFFSRRALCTLIFTPSLLYYDCTPCLEDITITPLLSLSRSHLPCSPLPLLVLPPQPTTCTSTPSHSHSLVAPLSRQTTHFGFYPQTHSNKRTQTDTNTNKQQTQTHANTHKHM
jgi:hypothetical protein